MKRTTVAIDVEILSRLRLYAANRGESMAAIIREAVSEKVGRPRPRSLGLGDSGHTDLARRTADAEMNLE